MVFALLVTLLVYRTLSWNAFVLATLKAVRTTAMVLIIIGTAASFSWLMACLQVPAQLISILNAISQDPMGTKAPAAMW